MSSCHPQNGGSQGHLSLGEARRASQRRFHTSAAGRRRALVQAEASGQCYHTGKAERATGPRAQGVGESDRRSGCKR